MFCLWHVPDEGKAQQADIILYLLFETVTRLVCITQELSRMGVKDKTHAVGLAWGTKHGVIVNFANKYNNNNLLGQLKHFFF